MNTIADLFRLLAVPAFAWVAWRDVATRRVADRTWIPLLILALVALAWDIAALDPGATRRLFALRVGLSVCLLVPLSYVFWRLGGFGGADAKAFMILAVLFPVYPAYDLFGVVLPRVETDVGIFSLTIVTDTVLVGVLYPVTLAARNALDGELSPRAPIGRRVTCEEATTEYGRLLGVGSGRGGLDLDALRMYLRWRGLTLAEVRAEPARYRDPESLPAERNPPGDGAIAASTRLEGGTRADGGMAESERERIADRETEAGERDRDADADAGGRPRRAEYADSWGAAAFLADIDSTAYGTSPEDLRAGLDALTSEATVWITPGIPFLVPLFFGLCLALVYGDLLFAGLRALGLL